MSKSRQVIMIGGPHDGHSYEDTRPDGLPIVFLGPEGGHKVFAYVRDEKSFAHDKVVKWRFSPELTVVKMQELTPGNPYKASDLKTPKPPRTISADAGTKIEVRPTGKDWELVLGGKIVDKKPKSEISSKDDAFKWASQLGEVHA